MVLRKAVGFNSRGATREVNKEGSRVRYVRKDGTFIIKDAEGRIVSYARNQ